MLQTGMQLTRMHCILEEFALTLIMFDLKHHIARMKWFL